MNEEEYRVAWIEAEYIVLGWWMPLIPEELQPNGFDDYGNLVHYCYG